MNNISPLSIERANLFLEYKSNPEKWAETCVFIPTIGGDEVIKFYEPQIRVMESFYKDNFLILLKSRQTGFSTLSQVIVAHLVTFYSNIICGVLSRDGSESSDFCRKVTDILKKQPKWLQPGFNIENAQSFIMKNGSQLWSSAISPSNPGAVFRGKAITLLILDETAFIKYADKAWTGIAPALSKAQNVAKKKGIPFGTIMLSTPNKTVGIGKFFFQNWTNSINNPRSLFKPHKIHWSEIPDFKNDPEWYPKQCELLGNDPVKINQEMELQFGASDDCLFEDSIQKILQKPKNTKITKIKIGGGSELWKFKEIDKDRFYLCGIDTAGEFGGDYSTIEVIDWETMDQVIEFKGKLSVKEFCVIIKFLSNFVPNNIFLVENNGLGNQVCEELYLDENNYYNIYGKWREVKLHGKSTKKKFQPGINTNVKTRPLILDALFTYVRENPQLIISERLSLELIGLVDKGNKIQADEGCSDDLVMAYAFCCYARHYLKESLGYAVLNPTDGDSSKDPFLWMSGMNSGLGPLKAMAGKQNLNQFNKESDRYIKQNFTKLGGYTNMLDLFGKKEN